MTFRGFLIILILAGIALFYFGKPQQWWGDMTRAAQHLNAVPAADTAP